MSAIIAAVIRHSLTMSGGVLMAQGTISADDVNALAGAVVTFGGFLWSLLDKKK